MKIFFVLCDRGYSQGAVPVSDVYLIGDDGTVTHGSLWTALESGTWFWNVIATHPVTVVEGDVLTLSDGLTFTLDGWV